MGAKEIPLPETVGAWKKAGPPQAIDENNIFEYMDGAGELYLAYHFTSLQVHEYKDPSGNDILVELYRMQGSDDAFGLLSLDWGGEEVAWGPREPAAGTPAAVPPARALYGTGLLRLWSDDLYTRVMAIRETAPAREAILKLGEAIVSGRPRPPLPALLRLLPPSLASRWTLKRERTAFFRSHLVLNSLFYLSHENILALDASCEAAYAVYEAAADRVHLLVTQYPDGARAAKALAGFCAAYLPERQGEAAAAGREGKGFFAVEDGWLGFRTSGQLLVLAFSCPDLRSAQEIIDQVGPGKS